MEYEWRNDENGKKNIYKNRWEFVDGKILTEQKFYYGRETENLLLDNLNKIKKYISIIVEKSNFETNTKK